MLAVCLASFSFILISSIFGMPISGTHTVIGALIGAGLAGIPPGDLNWKKFGMTVASWFISPVLATCLACVLFIVICLLTLPGGKIESAVKKLHLMCLLSSICLTFTAYMVIFLAVDNPQTELFQIALPVAFVVAWLFVRACLTYAANSQPVEPKLTFLQILGSTFAFWSFDTVLSRKPLYRSIEDGTELLPSLQNKIYVNAIVNFGYRALLVQAACLVCLAHGSNDVANSIAPLLVELGIKDLKTEFAYWLGGIGIAVGLLTLGYKVMETVGKKVIKLDFYKGFACQFATANCIIMGSRLGIPLSTTHCAVGALFGMVLCNKLGPIKKVYEELDEIDTYVPINKSQDNEEKQKLHSKLQLSSHGSEDDYPTGELLIEKTPERAKEQQDENSINFGTVKKILIFWGLTVPVAMGVSYGIAKLLLIGQ